MKIREVSKMYELTPDTLRYYEKVGLIGPISKNESGIREYGEKDLKQIEFVKCMRDAQLPIDDLSRYMHLYELGDKTLEERRKILSHQLEQVDKKLEEIHVAREKLVYKIDLYDKQLLEKNLK